MCDVTKIKNTIAVSATGTDPSRKEKLLAAALDVFGRYGFDGASTALRRVN